VAHFSTLLKNGVTGLVILPTLVCLLSSPRVNNLTHFKNGSSFWVNSTLVAKCCPQTNPTWQINHALSRDAFILKSAANERAPFHPACVENHHHKIRKKKSEN